jgi:hypothetical protein
VCNHHIRFKICTDPKHEIQEGGQDTHKRFRYMAKYTLIRFCHFQLTGDQLIVVANLTDFTVFEVP